MHVFDIFILYYWYRYMVKSSKPLFFRKICAIICVVSCLFGMTMCTKNGMFILQLLDNYAGTYSSLMIGCVEVCLLNWVSVD